MIGSRNAGAEQHSSPGAGDHLGVADTSSGRTPRIAQILPFPAVGGTEVAQLRAAQAASAGGYESVIFHRPDASPVQTLFAGAGFATAEYPPLELSLRSPGAFLAGSRRFAAELRRREIDLVHCADILAAMQVGLAARLARIPLLCHVRNRYAELPRRARALLSLVDRFAFVSQDTWRGFAAGVSARRGQVLYDGYEARGVHDDAEARASVRREFGIPANAPILGMVARVAPQKDYPTLVAAAERVVANVPEARFLIVGDCSTGANGEHHREVAARIAARGLQAHFVFTDYRTDVARLLNAFDVFVLATHWEGFPLVLLEAMAHGKPVVATAVDGVPELIRHGENGYLVAHQDEAALAAHLVDLVSAPDRRATIGAAGRATVAERFGLGRYTHELNELYAGVLRLSRGARAGQRIAGTGTAGA